MVLGAVHVTVGSCRQLSVGKNRIGMSFCKLIMRRMLRHMLIWCFAVVSKDDEEGYQPVFYPFADKKSIVHTFIIIIIINLLWRHSTGDQQCLTYIETYGNKIKSI